jgi:hypothetical protein
VDDEKEGATWTKEGGGWMTHGSRRKVVWEDDMMGEGPMQVKHRAAENDEIV